MTWNKIYPAKILLLGEYTVLLGGQALAVPFDTYEGHWCQERSMEAQLPMFRDWIRYLNSVAGLSGVRLDLPGFLIEIENGLRFCSNIPVGYGLGSSGALTAAVLDRFGRTPSDPGRLKAALGVMESFFHGKSSGLDPMVSFLAKPVLTSKETRLLPEEVWIGFTMRDRLFLWNSEATRQTAPLVRAFTEDLQDPVFHQRIKGELIPATEGAIQAMIGKDEEAFIDSWKKISTLQIELFEKMIPQTLRPIWKKGLEKGHYFFKLCGAGGGGFFLVYIPRAVSTGIPDNGKLKPLLAPSG